MSPANFRKLVWEFYTKHGRHDLPWRQTRDPYKILVSEVMLQQTQVERVVPFYRNFVKKFPTAKRLASASLASVLREWQGLGYNRRAKLLHAAAKEVKRSDLFTLNLEELPGVGPYTARAIAAFAFNRNVVFVETNIRTAIIHHFFSRRSDVEDTELVEVLARVLPKGKSREWYSALMDYGAHLKHSGVRVNARAKGYTKQKRFVGSSREARGALLRELARGIRTEARLVRLFGDSRAAQCRGALRALTREGLVERRRGRYALAV